MSTLIKNGRIVTAVDDYNADIFIEDEKTTQIGRAPRLNSSHTVISYAVFCLKTKKKQK